MQIVKSKQSVKFFWKLQRKTCRSPMVGEKSLFHSPSRSRGLNAIAGFEGLPSGIQVQVEEIGLESCSCKEVEDKTLVECSTLRWLAHALGTVSLLAISACVVVPVRVPTQERDVSGKPLDLDLTFLKAGATTRDELAKKLAAVDTGVKQCNLFWGRWDSSKWRSTAVGFVPPEGERLWHGQNLLIQLDPNGVVKSWALVGDKELTRQLGLVAPELDDTPLDLSSPVQATLRVREHDDLQAGLVLSSDYFEEWRVTETDRRFSLKIPRTNVLRIEVTPERSYYGPQSGYIPYTRPDVILATLYLAKPAEVHYGEKTHLVGKKLLVGVDPPTFLLLRRYILQTKHKTN